MEARVAVLESEMKATMHALELFTSAVTAFSGVVAALNKTLEAGQKDDGGARSWRRDVGLVLAGAAVSGSGVAGFLKFLG